jgi:cell division protein FtsQ
VWDLKDKHPPRVKANRRKREPRQPRDWKKLFRRLLGVSLWLGGGVLAVAAVLFATEMLLASDYFRVERVRVLDQARVSEQEIVALSNVRPGQRIFDLDLEMIGRKIAENPWIASARVERIYPREVVIRVVERVPRAVINLGYLYYVDGSGTIFKLLDAADSLDFPVVTGVDRRALLENPAETKQQLAEAMGLLEELARRRTFALADVSEVQIDPAAGLTLYTASGGVPVRLGFGHYAGKLDRLEHLYPELRPRLPVLRYIDLNVVDRVIVKVEPRRPAADASGKG